MELLITPFLTPPPPLRRRRRTAAVSLSSSVQSSSLTALDWPSISSQVSAFTSTPLADSLALLPIGRTLSESQTLLNQTSAAFEFPGKLDFSGIEDVWGIVEKAVEGMVLTVGEICVVRRTLEKARGLVTQLELEEENCDGGSELRYLPLLDILRNCNFMTQLEQKIEFCIDCKLSTILDRASEDLEIIRSERKRNMEDLDSLLKEVSGQIFQKGGIDKPLVTKRRSRLCVGIKSSHRSLLPGSIVLNTSNSGATYFVEPKEAVELNNMEVRLSNSEKMEEQLILSMLTAEIAESKIEFRNLLDKILELDLAFARAGHGQWINGVCPILISDESDSNLSVDIEAIQHPLLLETALGSPSGFIPSNCETVNHLTEGNGDGKAEMVSVSSDFPVPIDIKIRDETKVVVISGPNTGGKTASMKTLGLASVMSKAGMFLPAKGRARVPWFDFILADIGDHQSLEQNLSTFSGHISELCKILEVASNRSLVLIDEIGSGTDPSEGVALSASVLQYLKDKIKLAVVTTHYGDLTRLKEQDPRFENAAMEFSLETLLPTYQILWGSRGDSNALSIAKSIGFNDNVIERAHIWVEKLRPEKLKMRQSSLYQSLSEERNRFDNQEKRAASLHSEIVNLYLEIKGEVDDLERHEAALMAQETQKTKQELKVAKSQLEAALQQLDDQLRTTSPDQYGSLIKKTESLIASIIEAHCPRDDIPLRKGNGSNYTPQIGEQVQVKSLGNKLATVVETSGDDGTVLVQYGKIRVRVDKRNIAAPRTSKTNAAKRSVRSLSQQGQNSRNSGHLADKSSDVEVSYAPVFQTSKNTVDLRGMRVEEASHSLSMAIDTRGSNSVLFIIHGMGTGAVKECAIDILKNHRRVTKFEQESSTNYGCTVAYIN